MSELKPCPFCGGEAHIHDDEEDELIQVGCSNMSCLMNPLTDHYSRKGEDQAKQAWNTRSTDQLIDAVTEILTGIDQDEADSKDGWWETSEGVEFGKKKLDDVLEVIKKL